MFLKAFIIGFSIAMPVGPIGMFCIKNTLTNGFRIGFAVGLGAALADAFYGFLAGGGLAFISQFMIANSSAIRIFGGLLLFYLGAVEIKNARTHGKKITAKTEGFYQTIATSFLLTITNPLTILSFVGIFAAIGGEALSKAGVATIIAGFFLGSLLWWIILVSIIAITHHKIPEKMMAKIKIFSGLILVGFAVWSFGGL